MKKWSRSSGLLALVLALALFAGPAQGAAPAAPANPDMTVAYGVDAAHDGYIADSALAPPLQRLWAVDLKGRVSYPLVVGNHVFVVEESLESAHPGAALYALDVQTGATIWGPVEQAGTTWPAPLAYDGGRVFALNGADILRAYDAQTGTPGWSTDLRESSPFGASPVAHNGIVYVTGAYSLSAVDETTGAVLWEANSNNSMPVVTDDAVYATGCATLTAYAPRTGAVLWEQRPGDCGDWNPLALALHDGRLYLRMLESTLYVFDAATGKELQIDAADTIPAFAGGRGFIINQGKLQSFAEATGTIQWTFAGEGDLIGPPIVVHNTLYIQSSRDMVYAVDTGTGRAVFVTPLLAAGTPPDLPPGENESPAPLSAGSGELLVPGYHWLVAFGATGGPLLPLPPATPPPGAGPPADPADLTGALQVDAGHTGGLPGDTLTPPLKQLWSTDLADPASNALVVGGRIYVVAGGRLAALDARTGAVAWGPVYQGGQFSTANLAYDNGQVFAVNNDGILRAYKAGTGAPAWSIVLPRQVFVRQPPTAYKGVIYLTGSGVGSTLFAVDEATGAVRWAVESVEGSPAVDDSAVYVDGECSLMAFDVHSGASLWRGDVACIPALSGSVALYRDRVYATGGQDSIYVYEAGSGKQGQIYAGSSPPAFAGARGFMVAGGRLQAFDVRTGASLWSFTADDELTGAPIVVHSTVFVGSTGGTLYELDSTTGRLVGSAPDLGGTISAGLGAGSGVLAVPAGSHLVAFASAGGSPPAPTPTPAGPPGWAQPQYFPVTGHSIRGRFRQYWTEHGGLALQGYPLTEEFTEISALDGKPYTVQYFERAVFEWHPENAPPYDVLLSQLGAFRYRQLYPHGAPGQQRNANNPRYFPETGHALGGSFRPYWEAHGGLAQLGYPLSDEFAERSALDGQTYTVQYFERAVFEWHPENRAPYDVLLSQLGTFRLRQLYPQGPPAP